MLNGGTPLAKSVAVRRALARLEQLKRLPSDPVIVVVEVFRARVTLGAEM